MAGSVPKRGLRRFTRRSARAPLRSHCHRGQVVPPQRSRRAFGSQPTPAPPAQAAKVGHLRHRWPPPGAASISSIRTPARDDAFLNSQITSPNMRLFTQPLTCSERTYLRTVFLDSPRSRATTLIGSPSRTHRRRMVSHWSSIINLLGAPLGGGGGG